MLNAEALAETLKIMGSLPSGRFQDSEILTLTFLGLISDIYPEFVKPREEYYVRKKVIAIEPGARGYRLPSRAYLGLVRRAEIKSGTRWVLLTPKKKEEIQDDTSPGNPASFFLEGNSLWLHPVPSSPVEIRLSYWHMPSKIVPSSDCARVSSVAGSQIALVNIPTRFAISQRFDVVKGTSDYEPIEIDLIASSVGPTPSPSITFTASSLSPEIEQGDYVTIAGESPYAHLHSGFYPALLQAAKGRIFEALGDDAKFAASLSRTREMVAMTQSLLFQRVQGASMPISSGII